MEKAFECALALKEKHEKIDLQMTQGLNSSKQKDLRKRQAEISNQILQFLEEIQEFKSIIMVNQLLKEHYSDLVNYFSKQIHTRIYQTQMELDFLVFEKKFTQLDSEPNILLSHQVDIENIQGKLSTYYQLFKK